MKTHPHFRIRAGQTGVSLIESLIALTVTSLAIGLALPSFGPTIERRHLEGAAAQLETDILFTRSLSVAGNRGLRIGFQTEEAGSCYVVHSGAAGACRCDSDGNTVCSGDAQALRTVHFGAAAPLQLQANARSMLFDPTRGTVTPTATVRLTSTEGRAVHLVVNLMGRVRACSPDALPGYKAC